MAVWFSSDMSLPTFIPHRLCPVYSLRISALALWGRFQGGGGGGTRCLAEGVQTLLPRYKGLFGGDTIAFRPSLVMNSAVDSLGLSPSLLLSRTKESLSYAVVGLVISTWCVLIQPPDHPRRSPRLTMSPWTVYTESLSCKHTRTSGTTVKTPHT